MLPLGGLRSPVVVDLLYLDDRVCDRCRSSETALDEALAEVAPILRATGRGIVVNRVKVDSRDIAREHRFVSSPTIRVGGRDIQPGGTESRCVACGTLCGDEVSCRTWDYRGQRYDTPPKALVIDAVLAAIYGAAPLPDPPVGDFVLPDNLERFFAGLDRKGQTS